MARRREWVPAVALTRRIGGRLLRAANAGAILVTVHERETLVIACTRRYLSRLVRVRAGDLWRRLGTELASLGWVDTQAPRLRRSTQIELTRLDDQLDQKVAEWQG